MNESQYRSYASELLGTTGTTLSSFKFLQSDNNYPYYYWYHENETDWSKISYHDAFVQNYNVRVQVFDYLFTLIDKRGDEILPIFKSWAYDR